MANYLPWLFCYPVFNYQLFYISMVVIGVDERKYHAIRSCFSDGKEGKQAAFAAKCGGASMSHFAGLKSNYFCSLFKLT